MSPDRSHRSSRALLGAAYMLAVAAGALGTALAITPLASGAQQGGGSITATCKDGSTYRGASRQGACRGHGGVKAWGDSTSAPRPKGATAQCKDGSWHTGSERRGACAGHGGVKEWVKTRTP